jgi:hypothetical protein
MSAIKLTSAAALQDYTRQFHETLFERAYFGFSALMHATQLDGIKGEIVLTDLQIGDLLKRASPTFQPLPNIINYRPRIMTTVAVDVDFEINPKLLANTYLEGLRKKGQNGKDIPYEGQVMGGLVNKMKDEHQRAFFVGKKSTNPMSSDMMKQCFNGMIEIAKLLRLGGNLPYVVRGGGYTMENIVQEFQNQIMTLGVEALANGAELHCNRKNLFLYMDAYEKQNPNRELVKIRNAGDVVIGCEMKNGIGKIYSEDGFGTSNMVIATQRGNFVWGTDDATDADGFAFKEQIKTIQFTTQTRIGMEVINGDEDYISVNDLD